MTEPEIHQATDADRPAIGELLRMVFHTSADDDWQWEKVFEPDRALLIRDGDAVVAHTAAYTRELTVPGGSVPAAHVTMVGVAPTHRRRGLLTRLMRHQLAGVPEPVAVLWASEGAIYPRYGYGMASYQVSLRVEIREVRLPEPAEPGRLRAVPLAAARPALRELYDAVRADQPGWSSRDDRWWNRRLADPASERDGATDLRVIVSEDATGALDGYALWRVKREWSATGPAGEVRVIELVAATPAARLRLWRFLLGIDLCRYVQRYLSGFDDPMLYLVDAPARLGMSLSDGLYVRVVDVPAALAARRYATPLDLVIEVTDPVREANTGRWRLTADGDKASCERSSAPADLACGIAELGAAYLGGVPLAALAAAGRVRELRPGAVAAASTGFGWHRAPTGIEVF